MPIPTRSSPKYKSGLGRQLVNFQNVIYVSLLFYSYCIHIVCYDYIIIIVVIVTVIVIVILTYFAKFKYDIKWQKLKKNTNVFNLWVIFRLPFYHFI